VISYKNKSKTKENCYKKSLMNARKTLTSVNVSKNNLAIK